MSESARLLLASDRRIWVEQTHHTAEDLGHEVIVANNLQECIELAQTQDPDLIFLDGTLVDPDREQLCPGVRDQSPLDWPFIVVVFAEGEYSEALADQFPDQPDSYLFLPVSREELAARLTSLIRHKTARSALQRNEARLRSIFRAAPVGIGLVVDRVLQEVNEQLIEMTGYSRGELIGKSARILYPSEEEFQTVGREKYGDIQEHGTGVIQTRFQRKDGENIHVLLSSVPLEPDNLGLGVTFSALDITDRVVRIEELKNTNLVLDKSQKMARIGSWIMDLETDRLEWTDEVFRIFGAEPGEFEATYEAFLSFVHPEDRNEVDQAYANSLQEGRDGYEIEHRIIRRSDGKIRHVHEKCEHIKNQQGEVVRSLGMVQDITERVRVREELRDHRKQLEREVRKRTAELQQMVNAMAGREVRMADLKRVVEKLREQIIEAGMEPVADDPLL